MNKPAKRLHNDEKEETIAEQRKAADMTLGEDNNEIIHDE